STQPRLKCTSLFGQRRHFAKHRRSTDCVESALRAEPSTSQPGLVAVDKRSVDVTPRAIEGCNDARRLTQAAWRAVATGRVDRISRERKINLVRVAHIPRIAQTVDRYISELIDRLAAEISRRQDCPPRGVQSRCERVHQTIQSALNWADQRKID